MIRFFVKYYHPTGYFFEPKKFPEKPVNAEKSTLKNKNNLRSFDFLYIFLLKILIYIEFIYFVRVTIKSELMNFMFIIL